MGSEYQTPLWFRADDYHDDDGVVIKQFKTIREPSEWDFTSAVEDWCEANHANLDWPVEVTGAYRYGDRPWVRVHVEARQEVSFYARKALQ